MRDLKLVFATAALVILAAVSGPTFGQSPAPAQPQAPAPSATPPPAAATPTPAPPALTASDLQGLDVFGSEGQQLGKVAKVNSAPDGKVKDVEVQSGGFLGFFKTTYVLPVEKLAKKAGRIELSMTSGDAKQFTR
jgi:hypothetical protein